MSNPAKPTPKEQFTDLYRLNADSLNRLRDALPKPGVDSVMDSHKAGFLLGIQYVLETLRKGWTV